MGFLPTAGRRVRAQSGKGRPGVPGPQHKLLANSADGILGSVAIIVDFAMLLNITLFDFLELTTFLSKTLFTLLALIEISPEFTVALPQRLFHGRLIFCCRVEFVRIVDIPRYTEYRSLLSV